MNAKLIKTTVYLKPELHHAMRRLARADDRSLSWLVNRAVELYLAETAGDSAPPPQNSHSGAD